MAKFLFFASVLLFILLSGCTGSPKAELAVSDTDLSVGMLSNEDRLLNISVRVHNIGDVDAQNVIVTAKARPINADGDDVIIGSTSVTTIPPGSEVIVFIAWDTKTTYSDNMVSVTVDPVNSIEEYDKTNNVILFAYSVSKPEHPDMPEGHPDISS